MENLLGCFIVSLLFAIGVTVLNKIFSSFTSTDVKKFTDEQKLELITKMKKCHQENTGFPDVHYAKERGIIGRQFYNIFSFNTKKGLLEVVVLKQTFLTLPTYSIVYHLLLDDKILATVDTPTWDSIVESLKK